MVRNHQGQRKRVSRKVISQIQANCQLWLEHWQKLLHLGLWQFTIEMHNDIDYWASIEYEWDYLRATIKVSTDLPIEAAPEVILHELLHIYTGGVRDFVLAKYGKEVKPIDKQQMYNLNEACTSTMSHLYFELYKRLAKTYQENQALKELLKGGVLIGQTDKPETPHAE